MERYALERVCAITRETNCSMGVLKKSFFVLIALFIGVSSLFQVKLENYIRDQNRKYEILNERKRNSYLPAIFYYLYRPEDCHRSFLLPYKSEEVREFSSRGLYDEYIVFCYFTKTEREIFLSGKLK